MKLIKTQQKERYKSECRYQLTGFSAEINTWIYNAGFQVRLQENGHVSFGDGDQAQFLRWVQGDTWQIEVTADLASEALIDALEQTLSEGT